MPGANSRPVLWDSPPSSCPTRLPLDRSSASSDENSSGPCQPPSASSLSASARYSSQAARYPGIIRRLVSDGNEIGNPTFTHVLLSGVPLWQRRAQIGLTEAAIAG